MSLNWNVSGGGAFALIPLANPGKLPDLYPLCRGHTSAVLDTTFSPFDDEVVVSGGDDANISVWKVKPEQISECLDAAKTTGSVEDIKPKATFQGGKRRVGHVEFHPTAANVVAAATGDVAIKLFDIEKQLPRSDLRGFGDAIQSMAFDQTGSTVVATCRDRKLRMFDVRAPDCVQTTDSHGGIKGARAIWCGDKPRLITTGFSKMSERQMFLWDVTQLTKPIKTVSLDSSNGIIMPFWSDNNIVFLAGKGDGNIRYYELESDELHYLSEYKSIEPQSGMTFLPRRALNVNENEIARAYKVTNPIIQPLSFYVPRKSESFQADIFPPVRAAEPSLTADEFFDEKKTLTPVLYNFETRELMKPVGGKPVDVAEVKQIKKSEDESKPKEEAKVEPKEETKPQEQPKAEPKEEPKPQAQPKADPKEELKSQEEVKKETQPQEEPKAEPKEERKPQEEPKAEPKEERKPQELEAAVKEEPKAQEELKSDALQGETGSPGSASPATAAPGGAPDVSSLESRIKHLEAQVAERDTHIRELEMENTKLRANQRRVRDVLLTST